MKTNHSYLLAIALSILLSFTNNDSCSAQTTLIANNATWKYLNNGSDQGTTWRENSFIDTSWHSGPAELGFGDSPTTKIISGKIGYYFRKSLNIRNPAIYFGYVLKIRRDDGIVVYVNNVEVYRNNMPAGTIKYNTPASSTCADDGNTTFTANLPTSFFIAGNNIIAVGVHNVSTTSSDVTFVLQLSGNPPPCSTPDNNLSGGDSITYNAARIYWSPVSCVQSYNLRY